MKILWLLSVYSTILLISQGSSKYTPLVVYKRIQRDMPVFRYELGDNNIVGKEWQIINGLNREDGEFTYVNVVTNPDFSDRVFGTMWIICELTYITSMRDVIVTDTITSDKCKKSRMKGKPDGSDATLLRADKKGTFYVPRFAAGKEYIRVMVDSCNFNGVISTNLRERNSPCPRGSTALGGEAMSLIKYRGIACQSLPQNDTKTKFAASNWVDMVYPETVHVICARGYGVNGPSTYKCSQGLWDKPFQNCTLPAADKKKFNKLTTIAVSVTLSVTITAICTAVIVYYAVTKKSQNQLTNKISTENLNPTYDGVEEEVIYEEIPEQNMYEQLQPDPMRTRARDEDNAEKNTYLSLDNIKLPQSP